MVHFISVSLPEQANTGEWFKWSITGEFDFGETYADLYVEAYREDGTRIYSDKIPVFFTIVTVQFTLERSLKLGKPGVYTFKFTLQAKLLGIIVTSEDKAKKTITITGNPTSQDIELQQPGLTTELTGLMQLVIMILILWLFIQMFKR